MNIPALRHASKIEAGMLSNGSVGSRSMRGFNNFFLALLIGLIGVIRKFAIKINKNQGFYRYV